MVSGCLGHCQFEVIIGVSWWDQASSAGYIIQKRQGRLGYLIWGTARAAAPITYTALCPTGVQSQEELLLPLRHCVGFTEQPHPPAEEDVAGNRQVGTRNAFSFPLRLTTNFHWPDGGSTHLTCNIPPCFY